MQASPHQTPQRPRRRACVHALLLCGLIRGPLAAADLFPGLGLSADSLPVTSVLWDCNADACFTDGCPGSEQLWKTGTDVFWWDDLDEYESWTNSCDRDYDYNIRDPNQLYASACTWLGDCTVADDSFCDQKCIFNVFQDFNNGAAAVPGQRNAHKDLIERNQDMVAANGCALLAALIGTCDSGRSNLGLSPEDRTALDTANITLVADLPCPSESDATCAEDLLNQIRDQFANVGAPFDTPADKDVWPFAYIPTVDDDAAVASTFNFIGGAEEAKKYLTQHCVTGVLSANYLTYFEFSGLRIDEAISDKDGMLDDPASAAVMCRDNARVLENQLKRSLVRQEDKARLAVIRQEVRNGECLNNNELVHLDPDIRTTEGYIQSSMFGAGAGPAVGSRYCQQELLNDMRVMHEDCGMITSQEQCMVKRMPELQMRIAALRNAMITGVASGEVSTECLKAEEQPSEYVTCESGGAPAGEAATLVTQTSGIAVVDGTGDAAPTVAGPADVTSVDASVAQDVAPDAAAQAAGVPLAAGAGVAALTALATVVAVLA